MGHYNFISGVALLYKAGANVNTAISGSIMLSHWCDEAEAEICTLTRKDWVTDYANVKANFKTILGDVVSDLVCMKAIAYDTSGYSTRVEAQTMLDYLRDSSLRKIEALKDDKVKEVM
jgi:hypothetical protein